MSAKVDVVLLQAVKSLWQKNDVVAVSVAYAKNVLFAKWLAKPADASVKNDLAQKQLQQKKHIQLLGEIWSSLQLYVQASESLVIKKKVTPSGSLYEKVHESDVKKAVYEQWKIQIPTEFVIKKSVRDQTGVHTLPIERAGKKLIITFSIKESLY